MSMFSRTFHPDEANQSFTTGRLLETGTYRYDPQDHHGPTLYYAAAALQKAAGHSSTATLDPTLLRCTPLLFAVLALLLGFLTVKRITGRIWHGILFALLLGTSPIFVFFATDFIQEMLLAAFTVMMFWAGTNYILYPKQPNNQTTKQSNNPTIKQSTWALLFGIAAGLAFATKETSILTFAAAGVSALLLHFTPSSPSNNQIIKQSNNQTIKQSNNQTILLALAGFLLTATLLHSSFASNWQGVYSAFIAAPLSYLHRAAGDAASQGAAAHVHPWWQHLKWLFAVDWRLSAIPLLAAFVLTFRPRSFLHLYAIALLLIHSAIPYKTPWCALQIILPLAVAPCVSIPACGGGVCGRVKAALLAIAIICNVAGICMMNRNPDSKAIPYNYASASPQVKELSALVQSVLTPQPNNQTIKQPNNQTIKQSNNQTIKQSKNPSPFAAIALPPEDTWPLPFYLRSLGDKVGYWTQFGELEALAGLGRKPAVVVVPAEEGHLVQPLFPHLRNTKRFEMRPRVRVRAFW